MRRRGASHGISPPARDAHWFVYHRRGRSDIKSTTIDKSRTIGVEAGNVRTQGSPTHGRTARWKRSIFATMRVLRPTTALGFAFVNCTGAVMTAMPTSAAKFPIKAGVTNLVRPTAKSSPVRSSRCCLRHGGWRRFHCCILSAAALHFVDAGLIAASLAAR